MSINNLNDFTTEFDEETGELFFIKILRKIKKPEYIRNKEAKLIKNWWKDIVRIIKIYTILIMPLLHIKLDYRKVNNKNTFNLTIPEEIPSQMVRIKDSTIIL